MDMTWVTGRIAVGGGIWNEQNMADAVRAGITHVIDMQVEFDDTPLAEPHGVVVLWNAVDDDFQPKPPEVFQRGVEFALDALDRKDTKLYVHCAAGVHRGPMMTLAILCALGWKFNDAVDLIQTRRPVADFPDVYVDSVKRYLEQQAKLVE
jgi:protein-tyrosine phosphatase